MYGHLRAFAVIPSRYQHMNAFGLEQHDDRRDRERKLTDKKLSELTKFLSGPSQPKLISLIGYCESINL